MIFGAAIRTTTTEIIRPVGPRAAVAVRTCDVAAADRDMRAPAERSAVLALGGSARRRGRGDRELNAEVYDPGPNTLARRGECFPRLYHPNALLLPGCDGGARR